MAKSIKTNKDENFSEWFTQVIQQAELVDVRYNVQGFIVHLPWATKISRRLYQLLENAVEAVGHEPMLFPTVIPEEYLKKEEEHAGFVPEVFWITEAGSEKIERRLGLRPTGETQIYPMYSIWIRSHNQLPYKRYQSRINCFRNEMTTRPFLRGREFMFFETHDVFANHKNAMQQIRTDVKIMEEVIKKKLKIPYIHMKRPKWDAFLGADATYAADTLNPDGRRIQIATTHDLGQNFSKAFDIKFTNYKGEQEFAWQTCFGPGIWRIIAALIAIHGDNDGLVLPFPLAPLQIAIIPILFSKEHNKNTLAYAKEIEKTTGKKYRVKLDDRDLTPGERYALWEMKGVPLRIEIGPKEAQEKTVTIARRVDKQKINVPFNELLKTLKEQEKDYQNVLWTKAEAYFANKVQDARSYDELKKILKEHKGFVRVPWCTTDSSGIKYAEKLKEEASAYVCGVSMKKEEVPKGAKCIMSEKPAKHMVYIAKSI